MKKNVITLLALFGFTVINAQVGIGINTPNPKAMLDISSNRKGLLPPRLTEDSIIAMGQVVQGMVVYNTTRNCIMLNNGNGWHCLSSGENSTNTFEIESQGFYADADSSAGSKVNSITALSNGDYCVTGTFAGGKLDLGNSIVLNVGAVYSNTIHGYIARYNNVGICQWALKLITPFNTRTIEPIAIDGAASGSVFITGRFNDSMYLYNANGTLFNKLSPDVAGTDMDIFIIKVGPNGNINWRRREGIIGGADEGNSIQVSGGNIFVAGMFSGIRNFGTGVPITLTSNGGTDGFVALYDTATGTNCAHARNIGGTGDDFVKDIFAQGLDYYVTGAFENNLGGIASLGGKDLFVGRYTIFGPAIWVEAARGNTFESGSSIAVYDNNVYVAGIFNSANVSFTNGASNQANTANMDGIIWKLNAAAGVNNAESWVRALGGNENDLLTDIAIGNSGICSVTGSFNNFLKFHNNYSIYATGGTDGFMASYLTATGDLYKVGKVASINTDGCNALAFNGTDLIIGGNCAQKVSINGVTSSRPFSNISQSFLWLVK
jgi:hypothetical protein